MWRFFAIVSVNVNLPGFHSSGRSLLTLEHAYSQGFLLGSVRLQTFCHQPHSRAVTQVAKTFFRGKSQLGAELVGRVSLCWIPSWESVMIVSLRVHVWLFWLHVSAGSAFNRDCVYRRLSYTFIFTAAVITVRQPRGSIVDVPIKHTRTDIHIGAPSLCPLTTWFERLGAEHSSADLAHAN